MARLSDLAPELLIKILVNLGLLDIFHCKLLSRFFKNLISSSYEIVYHWQKEMSGVVDNPRCKMPSSDRFKSLGLNDKAWAWLRRKKTINFKPVCKANRFHAVTPSALLLGMISEEGEGVQEVRLPTQFVTTEEEEKNIYVWNILGMKEPVIGFGAAIEEHDLVALAIMMQSKEDPEQSLVMIVCRRYSTQALHDGSEKAVFLISKAHKNLGVPSIQIEICGENLAFTIMYPADTFHHDFMCIHNWKTGKEKSIISWVSSLPITFLREDLLLVPHGTLQIYHIPSSADLELNPPSEHIQDDDPISVRLIHTLLLPPLQSNRSVKIISCESSPNPTADGIVPLYTPDKKPHTCDPMRAIVLLKMRIYKSMSESRTFSVIMHRQALLDLIPPEKLEAVQLVPENVRKARDDPSDLAARIASLYLEYMLTPVEQPWDEWGPPVTRWFDMNGFSDRFNASTFGERYVRYIVRDPDSESDDSEEEEPSPPKLNTIQVLDFNPYRIKNSWASELEKPGVCSTSWSTVNVVGMNDNSERNVLPADDTFTSDVIGRLPYLQCSHTHKDWTYDGMMISEELLIGTCVEPGTGRVNKVGFIHIGF